jgi:HEAT repeat protein
MTKAQLHTAGRDYTDEEVRSFVADLESLQGGDLTVSLLVGCGERAIPPLREFLLQGRPRGIFQPRQRAVEALGQLGAKDVLMEYLSQKREIADAVVRFGEEAVKNTAARELARWRTEEVFRFLSNLAQRRILSGLVDALGEFERPEAAPFFVKALEDDVCRPAAENALGKIAPRTKPVLLAATRRDPSAENEPPGHLCRRRRVLSILSSVTLTTQEWEQLRPLLKDDDLEVSVLAAQIALDAAPGAEKAEAATLLIRSFADASGFQQIQIHECLERNYAIVRDRIAAEIEERRKKPARQQAADHVLRILLAVRLAHETLGKADAGRNVGSGQ